MIKWFDSLDKKVRYSIVIVPWVLYLIFLIANVTVLMVLSLIVAAITSLLAAISHDKKVKAKQAEEKAAEEAKRKEKFKEKYGESNTDFSSDGITIGEEAMFSATPAHIFKLIKNGNEEMQDNISYCNEGDDVLLEYDYEKDLYLCTSDGVEIGYLPDSAIDKVSGIGGFGMKINKINQNDSGKYTISIGIHLPDDAIESEIINFPIYTKVRGTTFEGRQEFLRESEEGDELIIKHSPTSKYPDTIAVINGRTGKQLGNIGADLASSLLDEFGEGCAFFGIIQDITGGDSEHPTLGCNITIEGIE